MKLIDLGMAGLYRPDRPMQGCMGSPGFIAPEVILGGHHTVRDRRLWAGCLQGLVAQVLLHLINIPVGLLLRMVAGHTHASAPHHLQRYCTNQQHVVITHICTSPLLFDSSAAAATAAAAVAAVFNSAQPAMDMYSLGVLLFIMLVGRKPWNAQRSHTLAYAVQPTCEAPALGDPVYAGLSAPAKQLLLLMLDEDPSRRPSAQQVLGHTWVLQGGMCKVRGVLHL